jgi:hypothetical protein
MTLRQIVLDQRLVPTTALGLDADEQDQEAPDCTVFRRPTG